MGGFDAIEHGSILIGNGFIFYDTTTKKTHKQKERAERMRKFLLTPRLTPPSKTKHKRTLSRALVYDDTTVLLLVQYL